MKTLGDLMVGARVCDPNTKYYGAPIVWMVMEHSHQGDPENSTAIISDKILCSKAFDAKEPKYINSNSTVQSNVRNYGNGDYLLSNILQWANSDADAWTWYAPQHEYDHPPDTTDYVMANPYQSEAGFLNGFSSGFKDEMLEITRNIRWEITRKIQLLTLIEAGGYVSGNTSVSAYQIFSDDASRKAETTEEATQKEGIASLYWVAGTGTPMYPSGSGYCISSQSGKATSNGSASYTEKAYVSNGFRPYCCLNSDIMVSEKPDENGVYTIVLKSKPDIPDEPDDQGTLMDGVWRIPKTDWSGKDAFNLKDYKRIRNNLLFLRNKMSDIWEEFSIVDMGNDHTDPRYIWKVKYFNAIEENLEIINKRMVIAKNYGYKQTFYDNGIFIGFSELNRIENATLQMKRIIEGWEAGMRRLSFRLGSPKGLYL